MSVYVLKSEYKTGPLKGQPQYFRFWTAIGPAATPNIEEAERFSTREDAMQSPAYVHFSSFYEPFELLSNSQ